MQYEIINSETLDSFIVPEEDFNVLKSIGQYSCKINDCNGMVIRNVVLDHDSYLKETELFTDEKNYIFFDEWFEEVNYCRLTLIINKLKDINSEEELRDALYEHAFITTINIDDIVNDIIDDLRDTIEDNVFEGVITYNDIYKYGTEWIDSRYDNIYNLLGNYFNQ